MLKVYGIPNCDTVKRARTWLEHAGVPYQFHDFKKSGLDPATLESWIEKVGAEMLVNRRGTTWRKLTSAQQQSADTTQGAVQLILENLSLIKRPVAEDGEHVEVGFDEHRYQQQFSGNAVD